MAGRKPITAIHCDEYTAKAAATSHGPVERSVLRDRSDHDAARAAVDRDRCASSSGTEIKTHSAAAPDTAATAHHHAAQPVAPMRKGPASSAAATPSGM